MKLNAKKKIIGCIILFTFIQYFVVTAIVASAWQPPFSWSDNYTSSLGNTSCGISEGIYVCSPLHNLMNASFIVQGIALIIVAIMILVTFSRSKKIITSSIFLILAGLGAVLLGSIPENIDLPLHNLGATIAFVFSIFSLFIIAFAIPMSRTSKTIILTLTVLSTIALILFSNDEYLGFGLGAMERIMDYTQAVAFMVLAINLIRKKS